MNSWETSDDGRAAEGRPHDAIVSNSHPNPGGVQRAFDGLVEPSVWSALTGDRRFISPTVTADWTVSLGALLGAGGRPKLSIHLSIHHALLHDVQRDQTRRRQKLSRSDAIQGDSLRPTRPHS